MRFLVLSLSLLLISTASFALNLETGDVILQPLKCWSCSLIEGEEDSNFAHIGIVVKRENKTFVAEAYGKVKLVSLEKFLEKTHPDKENKFLRLKTAENLDKLNLVKNIEKLLGNPYDSGFRWDNFSNGVEKIYCSELVYKVLNPLVDFSDLAPKVMHFGENPEMWDRFFRGNTPRGEIGISPEDFNKSTDFYLSLIHI